MRALFTLCLCLWAGFSLASAQDFAPDVGIFEGASTIALDPDPAMGFDSTGTIEFWVEPDWAEDPGYDPVIISNAGPDGVSYLVAILRDRDGLGVMSGDQVEYIAFDFTDGKMHHVALVQYEDVLIVYIDGKIQGRFESFKMANLPSAGVWIGSADGEAGAFIGAIASLRLWGYPVQVKSLLTYAAGDLFKDEESRHPGLDYLRGLSDFDNADFLVSSPE